jgi:ribosomal RNA-processing protein 12
MVLSDKPERTDSQLLPSWLAIVAAGYNTYAELDADDCLKRIPDLIRHIFPFLQAESQSTREAVGSALVALAENCMSTDTSPEIQDEAFQTIAELAMQGLTTRYQLAWREVFRFVGAIFLALRQAADPLFLDTVKIIEAMRARDGFEGKSEAEAVIGAAVTGVGPAAVLKVIPFNLEKQGFSRLANGADNSPGNPGRAWLLPILKSHIKNTELSHFSGYFVPLSERLYQKVIDGEKEKSKSIEFKILETVVEQIWDLLPSYCDLPTDLNKVLFE